MGLATQCCRRGLWVWQAAILLLAELGLGLEHTEIESRGHAPWTNLGHRETETLNCCKGFFIDRVSNFPAPILAQCVSTRFCLQEVDGGVPTGKREETAVGTPPCGPFAVVFHEQAINTLSRWTPAKKDGRPVREGCNNSPENAQNVPRGGSRNPWSPTNEKGIWGRRARYNIE